MSNLSVSRTVKLSAIIWGLVGVLGLTALYATSDDCGSYIEGSSAQQLCEVREYR
ncbi:TMhelix containing protein [Vibrio phage 1.084.O._10N.261.49.F5]|nr:TMhelix containing protein [Vibrio phage 1.084.O._10N.261.49.F5]